MALDRVFSLARLTLITIFCCMRAAKTRSGQHGSSSHLSRRQSAEQSKGHGELKSCREEGQAAGGWRGYLGHGVPPLRRIRPVGAEADAGWLLD